MNKKKISLAIVIFCFSFVSFFLWDIQQAEADSPWDYFTELNAQGEPRYGRGTIFEPDKPMIRPEYQGANWQDLLTDITNASGQPIFKEFGQQLLYKVGDVVYYNNVGSYNNRKLSLKITYVSGGNGGLGDWKYVMKLNEDGSLSQTITGQDTDRDGVMSYQLVYMDNKEFVKDIYMEFPQVLKIKQSPRDAEKPSVNTISIKGLKKAYLAVPHIGYQTEKVSFYEGKTKMLQMQLSSMFDIQIPQNYVIVSDNNEPIIMGAYSAYNYASEFRIFSSSIEAPGMPNYSAPVVKGQEITKGLAPVYQITQPVTSTYSQYYPDKLSVILEDKEGLFPTSNLPNIKVFDRNGDSITDKVTIQRLTTKKIAVELPARLLEALKSNSVTIEINYNDLPLSKIMNYYDEKSGTFNIPLSAYNVRKKGTQELQSNTDTGNAKLIPSITATPVEQTVWINSSTTDLDPTKLLENIKSSLPNDTVKFVGFSEEKIFDQVKLDSVRIKLQSQQLSKLTKIVEVPITVIDYIVTKEFFENQSWIINNINSQLSPKQIGKDVYVSDLAQIKQINTDTTRPFPGQYIPKNIKYFKNLELLYLRNTKMSGTLPKELGQLEKMKNLRIFDNTMTGEIPKELGNLKELEYLILDQNGLTGTVPNELADLPKLHTLYLNKNNLVGQLPTFSDGFRILMVTDNQVTYNSAAVPSFLTSAGKNSYAQTFIGNMRLTGKEQVTVTDPATTMIKPFDSTDAGYFDLTAKAQNEIPLYAEHEFKIIDETTKESLYEGKADKNTVIPYKRGMTYNVIMDQADQNPKNQWIVKTKIPELKLDSVPSEMAFSIPLGKDLKKPVQLTGKVSVFDNRDKGNWQLSMTPSTLKSDTKDLKGSYSYIDSKGEHWIVSDQKVTIEKGQSDAENEVIPISDQWTDKKGLQFTMNGSNFIGKYQGTVIWTLEDVPN